MSVSRCEHKSHFKNLQCCNVAYVLMFCVSIVDFDNNMLSRKLYSQVIANLTSISTAELTNEKMLLSQLPKEFEDKKI